MFGLQPCSLIVPAPRAADYGKLKNKPFIFTTPKLWTALVLLLPRTLRQMLIPTDL